jgi:hypothetical protein
MPQSGFTFFHSGPARQALQPLARFVREATQRRHVRGYSVYAGDGQPVLVLPEFGGGPESTELLRDILQQAGFAVHDWGLGVDRGPVNGLSRLLRHLEERVIDVFEEERGAVTLIGCGLSGVYAREVAKRTSPIVRQVITIGSPVRVIDPHGRCDMLRSLFAPEARLDPLQINRLRQRPPVPCTSIYSVTDECVPAEMSEDPESITTENLVIPARRHADLLRHARTFEEVSRRIARGDDDWRLSDD